MATEVNLIPISLANYSTLKEGSNPGAEHNKIGLRDVLSFSTTCFISTVYSSINPSPRMELITLLAIF